MGAVRLYDKPEQFAEMMARQLSESLGLKVGSKIEEPLQLEIALDDADRQDGKAVISLHQTYDTYMAGGDLNTAVDYMNNIVRTTVRLRMENEMKKIDLARVYPAVRDERYVKEAGKESPMLSDPFLPGLRIVYLEVHEDFCIILTRQLLDENPELDEEEVKKQAYANLKASGWVEPSMRLPHPNHPTCVLQVFAEPSHPIDCQFLVPEWTSRYLPSQYLIAYTNRKTVLLLQTGERMDTAHQARDAAVKSAFKEIVERSCRLMPSPVSDRIYWVNNGKAKLL
ncbi:hypothetical protein H7B90_32025 [Cohnella xylanilytica]|uniref:Uncharacterized protein n=1 Tax=Cohnella xylanilytica TaxID=557555 RepID=A0A841U5X2_9BACL|nr:hypothetical protein [Cohnella xylanilytica]MBB6696026.1 hypothetical protein [Cohnella xylanilytica]